MKVCEIGPFEELNLSDHGQVDLLLVDKTTWFSIRREHVTCLQLVLFSFCSSDRIHHPKLGNLKGTM